MRNLAARLAMDWASRRMARRSGRTRCTG